MNAMMQDGEMEAFINQIEDPVSVKIDATGSYGTAEIVFSADPHRSVTVEIEKIAVDGEPKFPRVDAEEYDSRVIGLEESYHNVSRVRFHAESKRVRIRQ